MLHLFQSYGSEGLQLMDYSEIVLSGQAVLQLTFDPGAFGHAPVTARCQLDHPFFVKNKGGIENVGIIIRSVQSNISWKFLFFFCQAGRHFIRV